MRQRPLPLRRDRRRRPLYRRSISRAYRAASDRAVAEYVTLTTGGITSPGAPSPARHGGCKTKQPPRRLPSAMKIENSSAFPPCFSGEIKANDGTLFSARVGWAEGPSRTPATKRARDLQSGVKQVQPLCFRARDLQKEATALSTGRAIFRKASSEDSHDIFAVTVGPVHAAMRGRVEGRAGGRAGDVRDASRTRSHRDVREIRSNMAGAGLPRL